MNEQQFAKFSSLIEKSLIENKECDRAQGEEFTPTTYLIDMIAGLIDENLIAVNELGDILDALADFKADAEV